MSTPIDDALDEAARALKQILHRISLTGAERAFVREAAPRLNEKAIELATSFPEGAKLRPMVIAWALLELLGPWDALDKLAQQKQA